MNTPALRAAPPGRSQTPLEAANDEIERLRYEQAELLGALQPILDAVEVHDSDTLSMTLPGETVLWSVEGSWSPQVDVTLQALRNVRAVVMAQGRPELRRSLLPPFNLSGYAEPRTAVEGFARAFLVRFHGEFTFTGTVTPAHEVVHG